MKKICVVGNFSGRNAGDAAILEGLLGDVYRLHQDVLFLIPTINKAFVKRAYARFPIKAVPLMPWNLSFKIFGLPIFRSAFESDLIMLTDAILFDRKLWNPLNNYLSTMAIVLPMAKKRGIPTILYNVNLGPVTTEAGRRCMQRVLDSSDHIITRDKESIDMVRQKKLICKEIQIGADCALNIPLPEKKRLEAINRGENILDQEDRYLSFNISSYLDVFVKGKTKGIGTDQFVAIIAETMDRIVSEMGKKIVFVITQPMDLKIAHLVLAKVRYPDKITLISNKTYSHNEIAGVLSQVEMHIGMRTHSLILATANCTPTIGIIATPKNRGYMQSIEQDERMIDFGDTFTVDNLFGLISKTWDNRREIRHSMKPIMIREKEKARAGADLLKEYLA
jgi:polysaccharide pyruvyl transferase WcaK-like protein